MKRNKISNRSLKFIERNSPKSEKVRNYISSLASRIFKIEGYDFVEKNNHTVFFIKDIYFLLNEDYVELQLYRDDKKIISFLGDSCWYQGLKFVKENFKI